MIEHFDTPEDGDVFYDRTPTAAQMEWLRALDTVDALRNIAGLLADGPMSFVSLRAATLHNEHTLARALVWLCEARIVARGGGRWALVN